ncbi:hypothetical protein [Burkholderia sp. ABCPW 14]|uniref:hypothetical protein n=1 Tax=Burkholderia sp. ABCPW 14 TaxID=1637860 RepID=UPI001E4E3593|nr:hypothetical protein [Burkholderia sp. ABCPW 14]
MLRDPAPASLPMTLHTQQYPGQRRARTRRSGAKMARRWRDRWRARRKRAGVARDARALRPALARACRLAGAGEARRASVGTRAARRARARSRGLAADARRATQNLPPHPTPCRHVARGQCCIAPDLCFAASPRIVGARRENRACRRNASPHPVFGFLARHLPSDLRASQRRFASQHRISIRPATGFLGNGVLRIRSLPGSQDAVFVW